VQVCTTQALTCMESVKQRLCMMSENETTLPDSRVSYNSAVDHRSLSTAQLCQQVSCLTILDIGKQVEEVDVQRHHHTQASLDVLR